MVHRHAHHAHNRPLEARDPDNNNNFVVVYKTLDPDFDGEVAGYKTQEPDQPAPDTATKEHQNVGVGPPVAATKTEENPPKTTEEASATEKKPAETAGTTQEAHTTQKEVKETSQTENIKAEPTKATESGNDKPTTTEAQPKTTVESFVTSAAPSTDSSHGESQLAVTSSPTNADSAASASSTALGSQSDGISSGAKAGIAIGVILGVGVIAALVFFFVRRKKKEHGTEELADEKSFGAHGLPPPPPVSKSGRISTPPQLKVRPVTQFAPDLGNNGNVNPSAAMSGTVASRNLTGEASPSTPPKSAGSNPFKDPANPFSVATVSGTGQSGAAVAAGTAAVAGATAAASNTNDKSQFSDPVTANSDVRSPGQSSPSPVSVDGDSIASSTMAAAGLAGGGPGPMNVYRVQMDFNPSMDDELALRTGSLVRMLHEYDDGWALCVRLDRSQQGVAPRSCLSSRPVKPRARLPPGAIPGPRGPPRMGPHGSPIPPAGRIPSGPAATRFYPQGSRPRSPGGPGGPGYARAPYPGQSMPVQFPAVPGAGGQTIRQVSRSMSPAPYSFPGGQQPGIPVGQRQFSNSMSNMSPQIPSAPSKPSSPPATAEPPVLSSDAQTIASSVPSSPPAPPAISKPSHAQDI
ncbi:hypothetical protein N7492_007067 [Penicillium capsulatum]|uniref:SH3 domain-containing protein n=1 Tax=Penicillium capsulatum TaxID=69766 RepID=A0A9W9LKY0_9EURO|nr:hypothetical protein N7492_007067 [Penicillium capsulatum]KAJ6116901.1 hypothetical protein N7512_006626 [Penicillium capsulatum]